LAKPNYHHARRQRELARKAKQQEKQQRRAARTNDAGASGDPAEERAGSTPQDPGSASGQ